jgi:hypothetical protein
MVRIVWGDDQMPIYLCVWHVLKVWCLRLMEKIKDNEVQCAILDDLHTVMYMPIESIETFMIRGRNEIIEKPSYNKNTQILKQQSIQKRKTKA